LQVFLTIFPTKVNLFHEVWGSSCCILATTHGKRIWIRSDPVILNPPGFFTSVVMPVKRGTVQKEKDWDEQLPANELIYRQSWLGDSPKLQEVKTDRRIRQPEIETSVSDMDGYYKIRVINSSSV
jgi:hypothetical protein